jgi:CHAT domain-containing protein/predicted negative regulator of RcsB-dependent stress response
MDSRPRFVPSPAHPRHGWGRYGRSPGRFWRRWGRWLALTAATALALGWLGLAPAASRVDVVAPRPLSSPLAFAPALEGPTGPGDSLLAQASPLQTSYELYQSGQLSEAAALLTETLAAYQSRGDDLRQAVALSNLALVQGQLGQWSQAQGSIDQAITLLESPTLSDRRRPSILAQSWTIQGQLELAQGNENAAFEAFSRATELYEGTGDTPRIVRSRINQAQALQANGFYRRAITEILAPLGVWLDAQPDSVAKAEGLQSLGVALLVADNTQRAEAALEQSLGIVGRLENSPSLTADDRQRLPGVQAAAYLSLGNAARSRQQMDLALDHYRNAAQVGTGTNRLRARLNQLSLFVETEQYPAAADLGERLLTSVTEQPPGRDALQGRINFAHSWLQLQVACGQRSCPAPGWARLEELLAVTHTQAQTLGDRRSDAYVTGLRGRVALEQTQWSRAQDLTEQALVLAAAVNAPDITYRWQEQLGQILEARNDLTGAIAAYQTAVNSLKRLRTDLLAVNPDLQFSFQQSVEPIHRKLVSLLIDAYEQGNPTTAAQAAGPKAVAATNQLGAARQVIESLQQEELNNYLRAACLDLEEVQIDQIAEAQSTAVIYPIILSDRLATIVSYPAQTTLAAKGADGKAITTDQEVLELYPAAVSADDMDTSLRQLRRDLTNRISLAYRNSAGQVYDWVIRPLEADLAANGIKTLVFVLDGGMRNVPMAALFDGQQFLMEKYAIALTPGLQLLAPQPLLETDLSTLAFGLSDAVTVTVPNSGRQESFSPLPNVETELAQIRALLPRTQVLVNDAFTPDSFQRALANTQAPIVHLATHGQFSSDPNETFIVTSGGDLITIDDLTGALEATAVNRAAALELLVLSACETAAGDSRAALGLAGIAVRAGARSTLASLWQVDDVATSQLMAKFYETLTSQRVTKAEALKAAQLSILQDPRYRRHPYFWAPFVMVGNWL